MKPNNTKITTFLGAVVMATFVELAASCPSSAQPLPVISDADARACWVRAYDAMAQTRNRGFDLTASEARRVERLPKVSEIMPAIVFYLVVLEFASAVIVALGCGLILAIAGICVGIEGDFALRRLPVFLWPRLALHSVNPSRRGNGKSVSQIALRFRS